MTIKRKLYLVTDLYFPFRGGQEESVRALAAAMRLEFDVTIIAHSCNGSYLRSLMHQTALVQSFESFSDPAGISVVPLKPTVAGRLTMLIFVLWYLPLLRRIIPVRIFDAFYRFYQIAYHQRLDCLIQNADLVQCISTKYLARLTGEVCAARSIPLVQAPPIHFGEWGDSPAQLRAYVKAQVLNCPTKTFKDELSKRVKSSGCMVEIVRPLSAPAHNPEAINSLIGQSFILFLGRKVFYKGLVETVDTFSRINSDVLMVIAGPGGAVNHSDRRIVDLGEVSDGQKTWLLKQCLFLCVPSRSESFGLVYIEAMREGKAVIGCTIPSVQEIVVDKNTGLLIDAGNIELLKKGMEQLIDDAEYRAMLGRTGLQRYVQYYSDEGTIKQLLAIYTRLTGV